MRRKEDMGWEGKRQIKSDEDYTLFLEVNMDLTVLLLLKLFESECHAVTLKPALLQQLYGLWLHYSSHRGCVIFRIKVMVTWMWMVEWHVIISYRALWTSPKTLSLTGVVNRTETTLWQTASFTWPWKQTIHCPKAPRQRTCIDGSELKQSKIYWTAKYVAVMSSARVDPGLYSVKTKLITHSLQTCSRVCSNAAFDLVKDTHIRALKYGMVDACNPLLHIPNNWAPLVMTHLHTQPLMH